MLTAKRRPAEWSSTGRLIRAHGVQRGILPSPIRVQAPVRLLPPTLTLLLLPTTPTRADTTIPIPAWVQSCQAAFEQARDELIAAEERYANDIEIVITPEHVRFEMEFGGSCMNHANISAEVTRGRPRPVYSATRRGGDGRPQRYTYSRRRHGLRGAVFWYELNESESSNPNPDRYIAAFGRAVDSCLGIQPR